jgi:hypothetical protein
MGCLLSTPADEYAEVNSSKPLLDGASAPLKAGGKGPVPLFREVSAVKPPSFKKVVSAAGPAKGASAQQGVGLFCSCGGPNSLVELLPCHHHALCLQCAQVKGVCPLCSAAVKDSVPSFRSK